MKTSLSRLLVSAAVLAVFAGSASAAVVNFTGGTVTMLDATTNVTNNSGVYQGVDYYEQNGFKLDFIQAPPTGGSPAFATIVGNYYGGTNDVIHAHWSSGGFGDVTAIEITKISGGTFDLNYFIITSNTATGGAPASGTEEAWIEGFVGATSQGAQKLPPEDWGFPATQIFLGSNFDAVDKVRFFVTNRVDCFGMDEFFIDQPAPVPEPATLALVGLALAGAAAARRRS